MADGARDRSFVHLTVSVLAGREAPVLRATGDALLAVLCECFPSTRAGRRCDLTVEVREMASDLYWKAPSSSSVP